MALNSSNTTLVTTSTIMTPIASLMACCESLTSPGVIIGGMNIWGTSGEYLGYEWWISGVRVVNIRGTRGEYPGYEGWISGVRGVNISINYTATDPTHPFPGFDSRDTFGTPVTQVLSATRQQWRPHVLLRPWTGLPSGLNDLRWKWNSPVENNQGRSGGIFIFIFIYIYIYMYLYIYNGKRGEFVYFFESESWKS